MNTLPQKKVFDMVMQYAHSSQNMDWSQKDININGKILSHLRFADDIVLVTTDTNGIRDMVLELKEASQEEGLEMYSQKTQNINPNDIQVIIDSQTLQFVE